MGICPMMDKVAISCLICEEEVLELSDTKNIKILNVGGIVDYLVSNNNGSRYIIRLCQSCLDKSINSGKLIRS